MRQKGVRHESGMSQAGVRQQSGRIKAGVRQESGRSQAEERQESGRSQAGVRQDSGRSHAGVRQKKGRSQAKVRPKSFNLIMLVCVQFLIGCLPWKGGRVNFCVPSSSYRQFNFQAVPDSVRKCMLLTVSCFDFLYSVLRTYSSVWTRQTPPLSPNPTLGHLKLCKSYN